MAGPANLSHHRARRQQRPRDAARIPVGAEENKLAFDHVLGLEPCGERPSVRWGVDT
jgi:hypothetical protein